MVVPASNPSTQEAEAGGFQVQGQKDSILKTKPNQRKPIFF
jgi:hypothetical protein